MNTDDPKYTAFAFGELTPAERAEIERELQAHPELAAELSEIREVAGILKSELATEPAGALAEHQRWAIIRAAAASRSPGANERDVVGPAWWQRAGVWQAVAACAVMGFGVYAVSVELAKPDVRPGAGDTGDWVISIPPEDPPASAPVAPEILTPAEAQHRLASAGGVIPDAAKLFPSGAVILPPPIARHLAPGDPKIALPPEAPRVEMVRDDGDFIVRIPTGRGSIKPSYGQRPTPLIPNPKTAAASIGKASEAAAVSDTVKKLTREAEAFREGSRFGDFRKKFSPVPDAVGRYQMNQLPALKVDAEFVGADGQRATNPPADDATIKVISKPYLATE
jgi:hypothetical protein